jgi:predicted transcriptional regulator
MLSGAQIRGARALLGISSKELAALSGVGWATIRRLELVDGVPEARKPTLLALRSCLMAAGIDFLGDPEHSPGVRLNRVRQIA